MNNVLLGDDSVVGPVLSADLDGFLARSDTLVELGLLEECSLIQDYSFENHILLIFKNGQVVAKITPVTIEIRLL